MHTNNALLVWADQVRSDSAGVIRQIIEAIPEGGTFIDIGANLGIVTAELLKAKPCTAILFEPVQEYADFCKTMLGDKATVECMAVGDVSDTAVLWLGSVNLGWNTLIVEKKTDDMVVGIGVPIIPLDRYVTEHNLERIDLIKIDVEGYEYKVLRGMQETVKRFKPIIFCEIGWGVRHPYWQAEVEQIEWLFNNGYQRFDYQFEYTTDVIFAPIKAEMVTT